MTDYLQYKAVHYWMNIVRNKQAFCTSADFFRTVEILLPRERELFFEAGDKGRSLVIGKKTLPISLIYGKANLPIMIDRKRRGCYVGKLI